MVAEVRVATISLGINDYADSNLSGNSARLHFADSDARAFHRYAATAWSSDNCVHLCLTDRGADRKGLENAVRIVTNAGPVDLFLLYLSGHGERGWFCLADAISGVPSLTSADIDRLLGMIDARQVLVIADHCYAEAGLAGSRFFSDLEGRSARIYIASARGDQKAWEDAELKRSILSDVLLKGMVSGSSLSERDGSVDVETKLIPHLRDQVPLEAAIRKNGSVQEPVAGGLAADSIKLPTVAAREIRRSLSIADALRSRLRRILVISSIALLFSWITADLLVYHLAIGTDGTVRVRPGPAGLYALAPYHLGDEIDTGFTASDLSTREQDSIRRLSRGYEFGLTTRKDPDGLASWLAQLDPALKSAMGSRARMLARAETPRLEEDDPPPVLEAAFISYATSRPTREIADLVYPPPPTITIDCNQPVSGQVDFTLLDLPAEAFARDLSWRALRIDEAHHDELIQLVNAATYRGRLAKKDSQISQDTEALASALNLMNLSWPTLADLPGWCEGPTASMVRALYSDELSRAKAEHAIATELPSSEIPPGAEIPYPQMAAIAALDVLVRRHRIHDQTGEKIIGAFDQSGDSLGNDTPLNELLLRLAAHQTLPENFRKRLFDILGSTDESQDFERMVAFRLLARNSNFLSADDVSKLRTWLDEHAESNRRSSELHDGLGYLAQVTPLRPAEISWLVDSLSPYSWLPPQTVSYRGEMIIQASDQEAAVALARVNRAGSIEQDVIDRLVTIAANRTDIRDRAALLRGVDIISDNYESALIEKLSSNKRSAVTRRVYADIAVEHVSNLATDERQRMLSVLLSHWKESRSGEVRLVLAEIIGKVRTRTSGFD